MLRSERMMGWVLLSCSACTGSGWSSGLGANSRQVALALDDPAAPAPEEEIDLAAFPVFPAPDKVRPCCAFGMDLKAQLGAVRVPGYENGNIVSIADIGPHGYDKGKLEKEGNGLVYTCRGGFIDIAHVRDNADRMLFLTMQIARALPGGFTVVLPDEGTTRWVTVKPLPDELIARRGRFRVATTLAEWVNFQLSVWHEIVTWYGWESIQGFSEKVSAFSPEDLYSNLVGQKIAAGIVKNREARSEEEYDQAMDAWIAEALRRFGAVSREDGRRAMRAVDGLWWDSTKALPDSKLVTRRNLSTGSPLSPWLVTEALPAERIDPAIRRMCAREPPPLPLEVPQRVGDLKIEAIVSLEMRFTSWIPRGFPVPAAEGDSVTFTDFPVILAGIRRDGAKEMGEGFDAPRPRPAGDKPPEKAARAP